MTVKDIATKINNSTSIQDEIKSILEKVRGYYTINVYISDPTGFRTTNPARAVVSDDIINTIHTLSTEAILYLTTYLVDGHEHGDYYSRPFRPNSNTESLFRAMYTNASRGLGLPGNYDNVYIYKHLSDECLKDLVTPSTYTAERARRVDAKFDETSKNLNPDAFAFQIFENHIKSLPKKLSGKDVERYIKKLPGTGSDVEREYHAKYLSLLWDNASTKSIALTKIIRERYFGQVAHIHLPFAKVISKIVKVPVGGWNNQVAFSTNYFQSMSRELNIPLTVTGHNISDNSIHFYVTGVKKANKMTNIEVLYAMDKIKILTYVEQNDTLSCPYYKMAIDQLVSELSRPDNFEQLQKYTKAGQPKIVALVAADKLLNDIKEIK